MRYEDLKQKPITELIEQAGSYVAVVADATERAALLHWLDAEKCRLPRLAQEDTKLRDALMGFLLAAHEGRTISVQALTAN